MLSAPAAVASGNVIHGSFFKDIFIFTHSSHPLFNENNPFHDLVRLI